MTISVQKSFDLSIAVSINNTYNNLRVSNPESTNATLPVETLLDIFLDSFLASPRQKLIGERRQVGSAVCIHYDYFWAGKHRTSDIFIITSNDEITDTLEAIRAYNPVPGNQLYFPYQENTHHLMRQFGCLNLGNHYLMERSITFQDRFLNPTYPVQPVRSTADLKRFNSVLGGSLALRADMLQDDFHYYYLLLGGTAVSQARSWQARPFISWESQVNTDPNYQRLGYGTAVMTHLLKENAMMGVGTSTLLATNAGVRLYQRLGYTNQMTIASYKWMNKDD